MEGLGQALDPSMVILDLDSLVMGFLETRLDQRTDHARLLMDLQVVSREYMCIYICIERERESLWGFYSLISDYPPLS